jgi:hypothetical protein
MPVRMALILIERVIKHSHLRLNSTLKTVKKSCESFILNFRWIGCRVRGVKKDAGCLPGEFSCCLVQQQVF